MVVSTTLGIKFNGFTVNGTKYFEDTMKKRLPFHKEKRVNEYKECSGRGYSLKT